MEQHAMIKLLTVTEVTAQVANFYHCVKSVRDIVETGIKVLKYYIDDIDKGEETIESTGDIIIKFIEANKLIDESLYTVETYNDLLHHINYSTDFWDLKEEDKNKLKESADTKHSAFRWVCMFYIQQSILNEIYISIKEDMDSNATTSLERINDFYKELVKFADLVYKLETMVFDNKEEDAMFYLLKKFKPGLNTGDIHKLTHPDDVRVDTSYFSIIEKDNKFFSDIKEELDIVLQNTDDTQVNISNEVSDLIQKLQRKPS